MNEKGTYTWKGPKNKDVFALPENYERIIVEMIVSNLSDRRDSNTLSIARRFLRMLSDSGTTDIPQVGLEQIQTFLRDISHMQAKSMDVP